MANSDEGSLEVSGFGATLRAHGQNIIISLLLIVMTAGAVSTYQSHEQIAAENRALQNANREFMRQNHEQISGLLESLKNEVEMQTWLSSIPIDERPRLIPPRQVWERLDAQTFKELEDKATRRLQLERSKIKTKPKE